MGQRHKHADVIIAWAEGDEVEYRINPKHPWVEADNPGWYENYEYRVKPATKKYRVALFKDSDYYTLTVGVQEEDDDYYENCPSFIRWLTDWVEYSD